MQKEKKRIADKWHTHIHKITLENGNEEERDEQNKNSEKMKQRNYSL